VVSGNKQLDAMHPRNVLSENFWKSLIAVVSGNLLYYFVLLPVLPFSARHRPFKLDLGLVVDVWVCLFIYGIVELFVRWRRRRSRVPDVN
jgi:ABC-type uncharacterized transport system permease subunit